MAEKEINMAELAELIKDALANFAHTICPHCEADIGIDQYLNTKDIEVWLKEHVGDYEI